MVRFCLGRVDGYDRHYHGPVASAHYGWARHPAFDRAVFLDGDSIGAVHPYEIYDDVRIEHLYQTLRHLIAFHIEHGHYVNFVIPYVFESPESLARLRALLSDLDREIYAFRLVCDAQALEQRIRHDPARPSDELAWYVNRARNLCVSKMQRRSAAILAIGWIRQREPATKLPM